jgi:polysaccharide pyruvyl transferase WcaK-like protein
VVSTLHPQTSAPVDPKLRGGNKPLRVGLFGCSLTTGNRGVTALAYSTIGGLHTLGVPVEVTIFDMGHGERHTTIPIQGGSVDVRLIGCFESRRYYRPSNLTHLRWANRLGLGRWHPMLKELRKLDAIFDISAGDSFSDIYGPKRFHSIVVSKLLAMEMGIPLILTPQTYGPFKSDAAKNIARDILQRANQVWARDAISMNVVKSLVSEVENEQRFRTGVDVAFGLPIHPPKDQKLVDEIVNFKKSTGTLIGLNVSGLLYTKSGADVSHYGFLDSYREMTDELLQRLLALPDTKLLLIPHVSSARGGPDNDCDTTTLNEIYAKLPAEQKQNVLLVPPSVGPTEVKWVIGQCAWFCGTRMHACIAALSQGVPATAIAYSDKTLGVFETAHVGEAVVDPRVLHQEELIERILHGMEMRETFAKTLHDRLPKLKEEWLAEFQAIYQSVV